MVTDKTIVKRERNVLVFIVEKFTFLLETSSYKKKNDINVIFMRANVEPIGMQKRIIVRVDCYIATKKAI